MSDRALKEMPHTLFEVEYGSDPRNFTVACSCGWKHSNTFLGCKDRSLVHLNVVSGRLYKDWNDPRRGYEMPPMGVVW